MSAVTGNASAVTEVFRQRLELAEAQAEWDGTTPR